MIKKFVLTTFTLLALFSAQPKSANAGVVIGAIAGDVGQGTIIGLIVGGGVTFATLCVALSDPHGGEPWMAWGFAGVIAGTLLDVDATLNSEELNQMLKTKFEFLNNPEDVNQLSSLIKKKILAQQSTLQLHQSATIVLSPDEISSALEGSNLTFEQFQFLVKELE